ncbi:putative diacylglycerol kinase K06A1.6 [Trichinella spiralis]|uniref:Diacylglycerol kinase n=1 Tax=Trichinella spiralis TaxID=6334 RepID=A0A0V1B7S0_TRISP|nr:putative diacylglycerol kinase K06A1.6 [Trichinella spiralis]
MLMICIVSELSSTVSFPVHLSQLVQTKNQSSLILLAVGRSLRMLMNNGTASSDRTSVSAKERMAKYWSETCHPDDHFWDTLHGSGDCHVGEVDCRNSGTKLKCMACHLVAHEACLPVLPKKNLKCKSTYADPWIYGKRLITSVPMRHHWVHRLTQDGRCFKCSKSFQSKLMNKEVIVIMCSWCKVSYHNKAKCFNTDLIEQTCDFGALKDIIIPPTWINKIPTSRCSTYRRVVLSNASVRRRKRNRKERIFFVNPLQSTVSMPAFPLLIFVNAKSGGKKGKKLFRDLCWLVNPRQVFELSYGKSPRFATHAEPSQNIQKYSRWCCIYSKLDMYRKCLPQLRILVCGGDGTVSWVFSSLDAMKIPSSRYPPIGIIPLGTGNDLSQTMGWGSTYFDDSIAEILPSVMQDTVSVNWYIDVAPNPTSEQSKDTENAIDSLPVNVMNNYFSIGVDAHIALQFHESRDNNFIIAAKPEIHKSRFKNRLVYGSIGTKDFFKRAWKDLSEYISLECDGIDHTNRIKELGLHCLLILNIPKYAGGTMPWGNQASSLVTLGIWAVNNSMPIPKISSPSYEDGRVEVVGFTAASLAALQVGGRGVRIAQCSYLRLTTKKVIPVQVDGEPCKLSPSIITISLFCKVPMLKRISHKDNEQLNSLGLRPEYAVTRACAVTICDEMAKCTSKVNVAFIPWTEYEQLKCTPSELSRQATVVGEIEADYDNDLEHLRPLVDNILKSSTSVSLSNTTNEEWYYLDLDKLLAVTYQNDGSNSDEVFHIDRSYEAFTSVTEICEKNGSPLIIVGYVSSNSVASVPDELLNPLQKRFQEISVASVPGN